MNSQSLSNPYLLLQGFEAVVGGSQAVPVGRQPRARVWLDQRQRRLVLLPGNVEQELQRHGHIPVSQPHPCSLVISPRPSHISMSCPHPRVPVTFLCPGSHLCVPALILCPRSHPRVLPSSLCSSLISTSQPHSCVPASYLCPTLISMFQPHPCVPASSPGPGLSPIFQSHPHIPGHILMSQPDPRVLASAPYSSHIFQSHPHVTRPGSHPHIPP